MGFDTSVKLYLNEQPPMVRTGDLARFLREFAALGVQSESPRCSLQVMFGKRIDRDDREMDEQVPIEGTGGVLSTYIPRRRNIEIHQAESVDACIEALEAHDKPIYRAFVSLGGLTETAYARLYEPSEQNERAVRLCEWTLSIGPVILSALSNDDVFHAGYMALSVYGDGYCFPRTIRQVVDAVRGEPDVQRVEELVKRTWPSKRTAATPEVEEMRRTKMGAIWPYDTYDQPNGWVWGINEG